MTNYTRITDFTSKDALATGNPSKVILGSEHQAEFDSIAIHIATKQDAVNTYSTETTTDLAADFIPFYDNSAGTHKKILVDNIRKDVFSKMRLSAFRATSGVTTNLASGATTNITLDSETYDYGSNFASNQYTVPYTGLYLFSGTIYINGTPAGGSTFTGYIRINSGYYYIGVVYMPGAVNQIISVSGSVIATVNAGDTVGLAATHNGTNAFTASSGSSNNLQGFFLRELS